MQSYLDSLVTDGAAGVLLQYRSGEQTWTGSAGRTELGGDQPVDPDGWFRIGSVTKCFTAVLVLQLVGEGKLQLDEPVGLWVPGMPDEITLRQVLNHTSGLHNYTDDLPDPAGLVRDRHVHREPSAALQAGLTTTQAWAAGALVSTATDLNRFFAALLAGELLRAPELEAMLTAVPTDESNGYGLGIERRELADGRVLWGHTGGIFGYLTLSYHSADTQLTLSYTTGTSGEVETGQVLAGLLS